MDKPTKPTDLMPRTFGGLKENYSASLQQTGVEPNVPVIYHGKNFNYEKNAIGQELDYCEKICDYINAIPINKTPIVDANNKLVYTQYDIRVYNATETYYENDYLSGFVNGEKHIYRCKQNNVTGQSLSDETYFERVDIMGNVKTIGRNIGEIVASTIPLTDAGLHLLDGSVISGDGVYSEFVDFIKSLHQQDPNGSWITDENGWQASVTQYGVCGKFAIDYPNNTVRLPKITGIIEGTTDVTALGDLVEAGLPNITGTLQGMVDGIGVSAGLNMSLGTGAFSVSTERKAGPMYYAYDSAHGEDGNYAVFNASNSSSVYGNSTTVQPQAIKAFYYIVIATSTKTDIQVDIDEIATDLNGKADVDLTNCTNVANIKMVHNAMPSNTYTDLTLNASGASYTAPADGYFFVHKVAATSGQYIQLNNSTSNLVGFANASGAYGQAVCLPAKKNDVVICDYTTSGNTLSFKFIFAVGSESEAQ